MSCFPLRLIVVGVTGALSLSLLAWNLWSPGHVTRQETLSPEQTGLPETRLISLDFPPSIRAGEADRVRLNIDPGDLAPPTGSGDVYTANNVLAEARLDIAGVAVRPVNTVSEPLLPGRAVIFFWSIRPFETGKASGTVWIYLHYIPKDGGAERRQTISAQTIEIESATLFGLRPEPTRWLGLAGLLLTLLLAFPLLLDALRKDRIKPTK